MKKKRRNEDEEKKVINARLFLVAFLLNNKNI